MADGQALGSSRRALRAGSAGILRPAESRTSRHRQDHGELPGALRVRREAVSHPHTRVPNTRQAVSAWRQGGNNYAGTSRARGFPTEVVFLKERSLMDNQPKVSNLVLLGALVAVAATAWAMDDSMPYSL